MRNIRIQIKKISKPDRKNLIDMKPTYSFTKMEVDFVEPIFFGSDDIKDKKDLATLSFYDQLGDFQKTVASVSKKNGIEISDGATHLFGVMRPDMFTLKQIKGGEVYTNPGTTPIEKLQAENRNLKRKRSAWRLSFLMTFLSNLAFVYFLIEKVLP
jgi:hypothetical protein